MVVNRETGEAPFLGRGWAFPPRFGRSGASVTMVAGTDDIHQSLAILFATEKGERVLRESFGSSLQQFLFEEIDQTLLGRIRTAITNAVLDHEPRIKLDRVDITESPDEVGLLLIALHYTVRETNSRFNMVYPFYTREASALLR